MNYPEMLEQLLAGRSLEEDQAQATMDACLTGEMGAQRLAGLLVALRAKGAVADELVGFAKSMQSHAAPLAVEGPLLDTCGTGGASMKTFNLSTTTAFVVAAAGVRVAKHGNRSVTRPSGSADVLEQAGARLDMDPARCAEVLDACGITFLFAPQFHPAMRHAGPVRKALGIKTVFNLLGPLCSPARAEHHVLGVYDADLVPIMAEALARLGCRQGYVLHGEPGCDEATPCGPVHFMPIVDGQTQALTTIDPSELGIARCQPGDLAPVPAAEAPRLVQAILAGRGTQAQNDAVALNTAFALAASGRADDLRAGVDKARELLAQGSGMAKWQAFIEATQ